MVPREVFKNGAWRNWALGITATIIATLVVQGLTFQREMRSAIDINEQRIKALETRARDAIIREFERVDKRLDRLEQGAQPRPGYQLQSSSPPFNPDELRIK
jgi:hypothetical protein